VSETEPRMCDGDDARRGRGDNDASKAAKSLGMRPPGLHHMDQPCCRDAVAWSYRGVVPSSSVATGVL
jgi:hypothetical protein